MNYQEAETLAYIIEILKQKRNGRGRNINE